MNFPFLHRDLKFSTPFSAAEAIQLVEGECAKIARSFSDVMADREQRLFRGEVSGSEFKIRLQRPPTGGRNAFDAMIDGEVHGDQPAQVIMRMRIMHTSLGMLVFLFGLMAMRAYQLYSRSVPPSELAVPLGAIPVIYALAVVGFRSSSTRAEDAFRKLLRAE